MADKAASSNQGRDGLMMGAAVTSLLIGLVLFYTLDQDSLFYRVISVTGMSVLAVVFFFMTAKGREAAGFLRGSRVELQKMVWPTRSETLYSTLVVFAAIFATAIFLWALDLFLAWFMQLVIR